MAAASALNSLVLPVYRAGQDTSDEPDLTLHELFAGRGDGVGDSAFAIGDGEQAGEVGDDAFVSGAVVCGIGEGSCDVAGSACGAARALGVGVAAPSCVLPAGAPTPVGR